MAVKEDLRITRTRKLLSSTLLDMMEEESIEKISVIDLCNKAMVNRATFYAHFEDKYHLLSSALEDLKDSVYENFTKCNNTLSSPQEALVAMTNMAIDFLYDEQSHVYNIILHNRNGKIVETLENSIAQSIKYQLSKFKDTYEARMPSSLIANFYAGGIMSIALVLIDNPNRYSKEELKKYCSLLSGDSYFVKKK